MQRLLSFAQHSPLNACTGIKIDKRCRLCNASNNCFCVKTLINKAYGPHVKFGILTLGTHPWHVCMSVCNYQDSRLHMVRLSDDNTK